VIGIDGKFGGKNFQSDEASEFGIARQKNFARASRAQVALDAVTSELLSGDETFALSESNQTDLFGFLNKMQI